MTNAIAVTILSYLRPAFYKWGRLVGNRYVSVCAVLVPTILAVLLASGASSMVLDGDVRWKFAPLGAPSWREEAIYSDFFGFGGHPYVMSVMVNAANGDSLFLGEPVNYMQMIANFTDFFQEKLQFKIGEVNYTYMDICGKFCGSNEVIKSLSRGLDFRRSQIGTSNLGFGRTIKIDYPYSSIFHKEVFLPRFLFGVTRDENFTHLDWMHKLTPITSVHAVGLLMFGEFRNASQKKVLQEWELRAMEEIDKVKSQYPNLTISFYGEESVNQAIIQTGLRMMPYISIGFVIMVLFSIGSVVMGIVIEDDYQKHFYSSSILIVFGIISPIFATVAGFGTLFYARYPLEPLLAMIPFLVLAIGVDDAFLIIHCWQRNHECSACPADRLGLVLLEVGPSILITSLTNCVAFAVGVSVQTLAIQQFCTAASLCMALDFVYEITFFAGILAISGRMQHKEGKLPLENGKRLPANDNKTPWTSVQNSVKHLLQQYCKLINTSASLIAVVLILIAYWTISIRAVLYINPAMSYDKLVAEDFPIKETFEEGTKWSWDNYLEQLIIVNNPPNLTDTSAMCKFELMVRKVEEIPLVNPELTNLWLRSYQELVNSQFLTSCISHSQPMDALISAGCSTVNNSTSQCGVEELDSYLAVFFDLAAYDRFAPMVQRSETFVQKFIFSIGLQNVTSFNELAAFTETCRSVLSDFPQFNATLWSYMLPFVDQLLSLKSVTLTTLLATFVSMVTVCVLLLPNLSSVLVASMSVPSISVGVCGFLCIWGVDLDPVSMCGLVMSLGFSVAYTAHISYHYHQSAAGSQSASRTLCATLASVGWPTIQAAVSTVVCVAVADIVDVYVAQVFVKTVVLVVSLGLFHGLVVIPTFLCALTRLTESCCFASWKRWWGSKKVGGFTVNH